MNVGLPLKLNFVGAPPSLLRLVVAQLHLKLLNFGQSSTVISLFAICGALIRGAVFIAIFFGQRSLKTIRERQQHTNRLSYVNVSDTECSVKIHADGYDAMSPIGITLLALPSKLVFPYRTRTFPNSYSVTYIE